MRFSVKEYGDDIARAMAIRARERGIAEVEGVFWASERGEVDEETKPPPAKRSRRKTARKNGRKRSAA